MANPKLNQVIAVVAGKKSHAHKAVTEAQQALQKCDQPLTLQGENINPDASKLTASMDAGDKEVPVDAADARLVRNH